MGAVQHLQVHRLSTGLLRGSTVTTIFKEMQNKAEKMKGSFWAILTLDVNLVGILSS